MRILSVGNMYPPHHLGGYELTWRSAVRHLRAAGHEMRVLTTDYRRDGVDRGIPEDPDVHRELRWYWSDHDFPRLSMRERISLERHNARALDRHLAESGATVVNWWAMGGMSLSMIARVDELGLPSVGVVGDDWMGYGPTVDAWTRSMRRLGPLASLAGRATGVPARVDLSRGTWLFNSAATREWAVAGGLPPACARVAHPGIDFDLFGEAPPTPWRWSLLCVGRIEERKGLDSAVGALAELPGEARLTILGGGDDAYLAELRSLAERLGVAERVTFGLIPRDQLPGAYAGADVLLFPVRWDEPWGLVPLESMAVGTPVVASGTGGSAEYLRDGENALVIGRNATAADVADAVRRLAGDEDLRARLRRAGLATAARFDERSYNEAITAALLEADPG